MLGMRGAKEEERAAGRDAMVDDDSSAGAAAVTPALPAAQQDDQQASATLQSATPSPQRAQAERDDTSAPAKQTSDGEKEEGNEHDDDQDDEDDTGDDDSKEEGGDTVPAGGNGEGEDAVARDDPVKKGSESPAMTENEPAVEEKEQQQDESPQSKSESSPSDANVGVEELDAAAPGAPLSVETTTANANATTVHQPHPLGANRTPSGAHPMYPSFPVTGMAGTGQQPQTVVSPSHQLQFPYASSNFVAPIPTPIRPLHGDPRAITQQQVAVNGVSDDANSENEPAASSSEGTSIPYPVPASRMFHHQTNSPSFYNTAQDGPAVGPSAVDPNFQKPWDGSANGTPAMNEPGWSNQGQPAVASQVDPPRADGNKVCAAKFKNWLRRVIEAYPDCDGVVCSRMLLCSPRLCQIQVCHLRRLRQALWSCSRSTTVCTRSSERTSRE